MSGFAAFMLWLGAIWFLVAFRGKPLQPDKLEDDLGDDVDMAALAYRRLVREAEWLAAPRINVRLSGRWLKR